MPTWLSPLKYLFKIWQILPWCILVKVVFGLGLRLRSSEVEETQIYTFPTTLFLKLLRIFWSNIPFFVKNTQEYLFDFGFGFAFSCNRKNLIRPTPEFGVLYRGSIWKTRINSSGFFLRDSSFRTSKKI